MCIYIIGFFVGLLMFTLLCFNWPCFSHFVYCFVCFVDLFLLIVFFPSCLFSFVYFSLFPFLLASLCWLSSMFCFLFYFIDALPVVCWFFFFHLLSDLLVLFSSFFSFFFVICRVFISRALVCLFAVLSTRFRLQSCWFIYFTIF